MYGIVICSSCKRKRITDLGCETSMCPYCSRGCKTEDMDVVFRDRDQSVVRRAFSSVDSSKYPEPRKKSDIDPDPLSTLVYEYEHTPGTIEKLTVLANGLTRIKGEFNEKDVEELFPGKGKAMLSNLISADLVIEIRFGMYKTA